MIKSEAVEFLGYEQQQLKKAHDKNKIILFQLINF